MAEGNLPYFQVQVPGSHDMQIISDTLKTQNEISVFSKKTKLHKLTNTPSL